MWFSHLIQVLKSSRPLAPSHRPNQSRPLVVEPLEDRLVLTGNVNLDVLPGTQTRPQPPLILTFVMNVPVNWFDLGWLGGAGKKTKPGDASSSNNNGGTNQHGNIPNGKGGLLSPDLSVLPGTDLPMLATGSSGLSGLTSVDGSTSGVNASVSAGLPAAVASSNATTSFPGTNPPAFLPPGLGGTGNVGLVTPAQSDAFFQQWLSTGSP